MTLLHTVLLTSGLVLALCGGAAQAQPNAQGAPASRAASKPLLTLQMPALTAKGITTIIMVGWKVSGSLAYTSVGATLRDYTVVIPMDTTAAATDYEQVIGFYQILNQGNGNLTNQPLKPKAPTLSRTDMITFQ